MATLTRPGKKPPKKPARKPVVKTLAQREREQAAAVAAASINPARADITKAVAQAEAQRVAAAKATEGITRAVAAMSAGDAEAARAAYAGAAEHIAGLGQGLTGAVKEAQQASVAPAAERIASLGAPGALSTGAESNANVSGYLNTLPADSLERAAAQALVSTQARRGASGLRLADEFGATDYKAQLGIQDLRGELGKLEAKRPGLIAEALHQIHSEARSDRATNVQIGYLQLQQAKTVQDQAVAMTNMTGQLYTVKKGKVVPTGRLAPGSDAATAAATVSARLSTAAQAEQGRNARAAAGRATALQIQKQKNAAKKTGAAPKKPTASEKATVLKGSSAAGNQALDRYLDTLWKNTPGSDDQRPGESDKAFAARRAAATAAYKRRTALNYGTAMARVMNQIGPTLRVIGYTTEQIRQMAARIVTQEIARPSQKRTQLTGV